MKLYTELSFSTQIIGSTSKDYALHSFVGTVPTGVDGIGFDYNDIKVLAKESSCINKVELLNQSPVVNVINTLTAKRPQGHSLDITSGKYLLTPDSIEFDSLDLTQSQIFLNYFTGQGVSNSGRIIGVGEYIEIDFGKVVSLDEIRLDTHASSNSYLPTLLTLKRLDGETWVECEDLPLTVSTLSTGISQLLTSVEYTAQKFRLEVKTASASLYYLGGFSFYGSTEPTVADTPEDFTWFLLQPWDEDKTFGSENPVIIGNAGGPNGNKEVALTHYQNEAGKEVKLMNFKLKCNVIGEV